MEMAPVEGRDDRRPMRLDMDRTHRDRRTVVDSCSGNSSDSRSTDIDVVEGVDVDSYLRMSGLKEDDGLSTIDLRRTLH